MPRFSLSPLTPQEILNLDSKPQAAWANCPGLNNMGGAYEHSRRDNCSSCAPYWERFPICPVHRHKLPTSGFCKECRRFYSKVEGGQ